MTAGSPGLKHIQFSGNVVISCVMNEEQVFLVHKRQFDDPTTWFNTLKVHGGFREWLELAFGTLSGYGVGYGFERTTGAQSSALGAGIGLASQFWNKVDKDGYYNAQGKLIFEGVIFKNTQGQLIY